MSASPNPAAGAASAVPVGPAAKVVVRALARHPELVPVAVAELARLARPRWWQRRPPLPLPTPELWRLRMVTAYGGAGDALPSQADVVSFLHWCREMRRWRKA